VLAILALLASTALHADPIAGRSPWSVSAPRTATHARRSSADPPRIEAATEFSKGEAAYQRGEYERASEHFARAYALAPHPFTLYNLGMSQARAGDAVSAWSSFDRLSKEAPTPKEQRDAVAQREQLRPSVSLLHLEARRGTTMCLDGEEVVIASSPAVIPSRPGPHELRVGDAAFVVNLRAGATHMVDVEARSSVEHNRRTQRVLLPLLTTTVVGAGVGTGLGVAAATASTPRARQGLAAGAAVASGVALGTAITALVVRVRARPERQRDTITTDCGK
jgi:hypothetical protein